MDSLRTYQFGAGGTARLWDVATRKPLGPPRTDWGRVYAVAFGPDGRTLATGNTGHSARLWEVNTGQPLGTALVGPSTDRWPSAP